MAEKEDFLAAIREAWDDTVLRAVYADWLDEHGEHEEAARQRNWTETWEASFQWMAEFGKKISVREAYPISADEYRDEPEYASDGWYRGMSNKGVTVDELLELGRAFVNRRDTYGSLMHLPFDIPDSVRGQQEEFWTHFEVLTGLRLEGERRENGLFSCSC
jgi:uncharacterized protein (TIGR02996 family)